VSKLDNLVTERLRSAVAEAYPPGYATVRTHDLVCLLDACGAPPESAPPVTAEAEDEDGLNFVHLGDDSAPWDS
jgi:hypothetical protein